MKEQSDFITIFNDVIGPVMRGPSSSHTAGGYRIAKIAVSLFGRLPRSVLCTFDPDGSYAPTYRPLGVDKAFCAGLIGMDMLDTGYDSAIEKAGEILNMKFAVAPLKFNDHPNTARIDMTGEKPEDTLTVWARSTGGGVVDIFWIDDTPVRISGKNLDTVVFLDTDVPADSFCDYIRNDPAYQLIGPDTSDSPLLQVRIVTGSPADIRGLREYKGVSRVLTGEPVFFPQGGESLFESAEQILALADAEELSLGEAGLAFEKNILGISAEEAAAEMLSRYKVMGHSVSEGLDGKSVKLAWLKPHAAQITEANEMNRLPFGGFHTRAAARAMAAMHSCNSRGIVCAAPTGGSAGVLPAVVMTLEEQLELSEKAVGLALFAAGVVGLIMAKRATFAAETAGCQVEIGIAGAMAAAAAVDAAGGSAKDALDAAAIALQNTMGSVCDPVGGGCEIPCHTRNALAAAAAFVNADLILGGYPNPIPLDESIDASFDVGRMLPSELRCTARGGIAVAPSAMGLVKKNKIKGEA